MVVKLLISKFRVVVCKEKCVIENFKSLKVKTLTLVDKVVTAKINFFRVDSHALEMFT